MSRLDEVIKDINKKIGFNMVGGSVVKQRDYKMIPSRTPALSYLFHGGIPRTIIELIGAESSGKSSTAYMIVGEVQKQLKQEWEDEVAELESIDKPTKEQQLNLSKLKEIGHKKVVYLDCEFTTTEDWMRVNGVDVDDLIYIAPDNQTAETLMQILLDLLDSEGVGFIVLDSVPALVSQQAMDKTMSEKTYAGISAPMSTFCSKLLPRCNKYNAGFIFIQQMREDLGGYNRIITPGGKMLKHTCSIRMLLKKSTLLDENYNELKSHCELASGNVVEVEVIKNKATKPDRRMCKFTIDYNRGIEGLPDTVTMAIGFGIIIRTGAWYSFKDYKWQGKANVVKELRENKELYNEIHELVMEECRK